jgi:RNA exonuclease 1
MKIAGYPIHPLHEEDFTDDAEIVSTPIATETSSRKTVIGIDCEMCRTEAGMEITRVTLVDFQGNTLYDQLVKPPNPILDYLTTYRTLFSHT